MESASKTNSETASVSSIGETRDPMSLPNYWALRGKELIDREFSRLQSVEEIASLLGISTGHFREKFRMAYGVTPKAYLVQAKISEAKKLLESQSDQICKVALSVGIPSTRVFRNCFKELVGATPSQFRKKRLTVPSDLRK